MLETFSHCCRYQLGFFSSFQDFLRMKRVPYEKRLKEALVWSFSGSDWCIQLELYSRLFQDQHLHFENI